MRSLSATITIKLGFTDRPRSRICEAGLNYIFRKFTSNTPDFSRGWKWRKSDERWTDNLGEEMTDTPKWFQKSLRFC